MQSSDKANKKPALTSQQAKGGSDSIQIKTQKIDVFYRYHIASLYRQLKLPIYQRLIQVKKEGKQAQMPHQKKNVSQLIEILYKYACLNSKYRHRQKMRFERTPLLKYVQFDFVKLKNQLKNKQNLQIYDDLQDDDDDDEGPVKKQYQKDSTFSEQSIANYKKKNNINGKIVIALGYQDLKDGLISNYGWQENEDHGSLIYDLKFMSKKKDLDYVNLLDGQYINHFQQNKSITAKFGLARNIRNLAGLGRDSSVIFPRCFDLNDVAELQDFYEEFKFSQLKSHLIKFIAGNGSIFNQQVKIMKLIMNQLSKQLLPLQKKLQSIKKDRNLFISHQDWKIIENWSKLEKGDTIVDEQLLKQAKVLSQQLQKNDPQWSLNKDNIWIVKPASMSRGRGIKTFNDLQQILQYVVGCEISWVAQKYIERPLIIRKKKFDIRQWVLWTDFKPLRAWMYEQCYIRFCAEIYTPQDLKNRKIHLTNNSVTKGINSQQDGIDGNMMEQTQFRKEIQALYGKQIFNTVIKPQMRKIAVESLQSVIENVQYRKNSFQILGYDFMIDQDLKVWLIQVNSSPTMEYSTKVTTRLVKRGMNDLADLIQNYVMKNKQYRNDKAKQLYGGWQLLPIHGKDKK